jgi:hypothetical protein
MTNAKENDVEQNGNIESGIVSDDPEIYERRRAFTKTVLSHYAGGGFLPDGFCCKGL